MCSVCKNCTHIFVSLHVQSCKHQVQQLEGRLCLNWGCRTTVSPLRPAGALRQKLWSLTALMWVSVAAVHCLLWPLRAVTFIIYPLCVLVSSSPITGHLVGVVYNWMRSCTSAAISVCGTFPKEIQIVKLRTERDGASVMSLNEVIEYSIDFILYA